MFCHFPGGWAARMSQTEGECVMTRTAIAALLVGCCMTLAACNNGKTTEGAARRVGLLR